ncbi:hypothetical protein VDGE_30716 [Verticillium dahliae]|uniref:Uncharacterized protein n=1 Tax=Verticillium dahliae TaxID=27337 RepID=A0A444RLB3_VERDA|nr:hypothetical protein VDGE_30716 [Verticillium dahliae]
MHYHPRKPLARRMSASPTRLGTHSATTSLLPADEELSTTIESPRKSNRQPSKQHAWLRSWRWWWEIAGCMVSITGCGLLFMMLGSIDQSPRLSWHGFLNIEPNTYIAIIATASRTATTVPITSCLSQLKWQHFQSRAHRLNHMDLIDKASRGPWGSLQALFMLGKANMVISMLAITTILSLAIGPSVQHVLEIHTREAIDYSLVPELAYATNYTSKVLYTTQNDSATLEGVEPMSRLQFASNMIRGITKNGTVLSSLCIGGSCRWPEYTTLGMCTAPYGK